MTTQSMEPAVKSLMKHEAHEELLHQAPNVDNKSTDIPVLVIMILLYVTNIILSKECKEHENYERKRQEGELLKHIGELEKEFGELEKEFGELLKHIGELLKHIDDRRSLYRMGWQKASLYPDWRKEFFQAVNVTLDPDTAHSVLILSEENRRVSWGEKPQDLPDNPQRFSALQCVLGQQLTFSENYYWEVEVRNSTAWDLGICRHDVEKKGRISIKPDDGFWAIRFYKGECWALTSPETLLNVKEHPVRVCIFLEYANGCVSFYNMTDKSHIYTFSQGSFDRYLRPFLRLWSKDSGHLTICPRPESA